MTGKAGIDLTPYFNVEGFVRHLCRNAQTDPQDPFFLNNGLVVDAPGYNTKTEETLARVEGTLKLFDDRWIQSAKWTGSRTGVTGIENFAQTSASLGTAQTLTYKSSAAARQRYRRRREAPHHRPRWKTAASSSRFDSIFLFGPDLDAARNGYTRSTNSVGGEYVLDLLRDRHHDFGRAAAGLQRAVRGRIHLALFALAEGRHDRRAPAFEHRARRDQSELHRAVRLRHQHIPAQSQSRAGKLDRLGCGMGADVLERARGRRRDLFQFACCSTRSSWSRCPTSRPRSTTSTGTSTRQGVEATGKFRPLDWLTLAGTYTYTDARDDKGVQEIRRPQHAASGSATVSFVEGRGKATLNVDLQRPDARHDVHASRRRPTTLAAYTLVGGMISYDTTPWSTIYLRAENVFNRRYEEVFSYRSPGAAVYAGVKVRTN